jgi:hypothetical protein
VNRLLTVAAILAITLAAAWMAADHMSHQIGRALEGLS